MKRKWWFEAKGNDSIHNSLLCQFDRNTGIRIHLLCISLSLWILVHIKAGMGDLTPKLFCWESKVYWSKETMLSSLKWKLNLILRKKTKRGKCGDTPIFMKCNLTEKLYLTIKKKKNRMEWHRMILPEDLKGGQFFLKWGPGLFLETCSWGSSGVGIILFQVMPETFPSNCASSMFVKFGPWKSRRFLAQYVTENKK